MDMKNLLEPFQKKQKISLFSIPVIAGAALALIERFALKRSSERCSSLLLPLLVALFALLVFGCGESAGETLYVDDDADSGGNGSQGSPFNKIHDAMDVCQDGDMVRVWEGEYRYNHEVLVNRSIDFIGNGSETTTIDGREEGVVVRIVADWVNMSGFHIIKSGEYGTGDGIRIESDHNNIFENNCSANWNNGMALANANYNNIFENNCSANWIDGMTLFNASYNNISNNQFKENDENGLFLEKSDNNTIYNNIFMANNHWGIKITGEFGDHSHHNRIIENVCLNDGIQIERGGYNEVAENYCSESSITIRYSEYNLVRNNTCIYSYQAGIHLERVNHNRIENNSCYGNYENGIYLVMTGHSILLNNNCSNNSRGISVKDSNNISILKNICSKNIEGEGFGIYLNLAENNTITGNRCENNLGNGIKLYYSDNNNVTDNVCVGNGEDTRLNEDNGIKIEESWYNTIENNNCSANVYSGIEVFESKFNILKNNTCLFNVYGIQIWGYTNGEGQVVDNIGHHSIERNNCSFNEKTGILLRSGDSLVKDNVIIGNPYGITAESNRSNIFFSNTLIKNGLLLSGESLEFFSIHTIPTNNTVNGKQIYCYKNETDMTIPPGAGQIILVGCSGISIDEYYSGETGGFISIAFSSDILVTGNTLSRIDLSGSDHNVISSNTFPDVKGVAIDMDYSDHNTIGNNTLTGKSRLWNFTDYHSFTHGISLYYSSNNIIKDNELSDLYHGLYLVDSDSNKITDNTIRDNVFGIWLHLSYDNEAHYNRFYDNAECAIATFNEPGKITDASHNYWGSNSGPYHPDDNKHGKGDNVSDYVKFRPWLNEDGKVNKSSIPKEEFLSREDAINISLIVIAAIAALAYASHVSEAFRYRLQLLWQPLYTRINRKTIESDIHHQNLRGQIYKHIKEKPGASFSAIRKAVEAGSGTTVYHLSVLQLEGDIRSMVSGRSKLFWLKDKFPGPGEIVLTGIQKKIVVLLELGGEMTHRDIANKLDVSRSAVYFNIQKLLEKDLISEEKRGKTCYCSLNCPPLSSGTRNDHQ